MSTAGAANQIPSLEVNVALISLRQLLECGVHFGHPTRKWSPKMAPYIYTKRNGIHILDLQQTTKFIDEVHTVVQDFVGRGKVILFVGTKKQAQDAVREEATKCGMPFVCNRWPGGLLTNRETMSKRVERLHELRKLHEEGYFETLTKKDAKFLSDEMAKLEKNFGGIADMTGLPDLMFIVDVNKEQNAVNEAKKLKIPIIGILDTNCDPDDVNYKLPGNDDAIRSIRLFCQIISDSVMEAKYGYLPPDSVFIRAAEEDEEALAERKAAKEAKESKNAEAAADDPTVSPAELGTAEVAADPVAAPPAPALAGEDEPVEAAPVVEAAAEVELAPVDGPAPVDENAPISDAAPVVEAIPAVEPTPEVKPVPVIEEEKGDEGSAVEAGEPSPVEVTPEVVAEEAADAEAVPKTEPATDSGDAASASAE